MKKAALILIFLSILNISGCKKNEQASGQTKQEYEHTEQQKEVQELKIECCVRCNYGARVDVRAIDITMEPCLYYKDTLITNDDGETLPVLSPQCTQYFEDNNLSVKECINFINL